MHQSFKQKLATEIALLANKASGWHFSTVHVSAEQFENFSMVDMARRLETEAPLVWDVIGHLLESDSLRAARRSHYKNTTTTSTTSSSSETSPWSEEDEYWAQLDDDLAGPPAEGATDEPPSKCQRRAADRNVTLLQIRCVIIVSILLNTTNKCCNAIAAIIGMLCHATSAPELVIELLSHIRISTSTTAIHDMVSLLSSKSYRKLRLLAKTLLAALAYDNFDMDFKSSQPTVGKPEVTLKHTTSVLALPLLHVVADDLKCSAELWASDPMNP
ncbi:hypothetical protein BDN71DRAFT_1533419, partial [Pleurotus eryngii]